MSKQKFSLLDKPGRKRNLALIDEFFAVLMHLRLGLLLENVADRFRISSTTMSRLFITWVLFLAKELQLLFPRSSKELVQKHASLISFVIPTQES